MTSTADSVPEESDKAIIAIPQEEEDEDEADASQLRQSPLEIIVVTPSGTRVVVSSVSLSEPTSFVRQVLQEFQEVAPFTNYEFEIDGKVVNDYVEVGHYAPIDEESSQLVLVMKPALYDIKKSRLQLKRARDIIAYPPLVKGVIVDATDKNDEEVDASAKLSAAEKSKDTCSKASVRAKLPKAEEIFASATLEGFFAQTMLRAGSPETAKVVAATKSPSDCVKSLSASGWNPPPPPRRAQGDLFYIEAVTEEAVLHITCCPSGFYVNKSTRYFFDPTPAANAHFSHELFFTLLGSSLSLRTAWHAVCAVAPKVNPSKPLETTTGALDVVSTLYSQGREDQIFLRPQWTVPPVGPGARVGDAEASVKGAKHSFDISRLHDDLGDQFGAEDPGAPREWNEEMQSIRSLATKEIADKVMKAKFIHKFYYEFAEAVKAGAVAIFEGHIAPINPMDSEKTQVYVYNNIFYSRAVDTKENFKICQGDEANRKLAGHDIKNQRLIQAVGVDGLCTVLSCVVDFKGERMVGQTIIPGVLQTGVHSARLLYGALEIGKRMTVKTEGLALMEALFSKLYIAKRNIAAIPVVTISNPQPTDEDIEAENAAKAAQNGISGLFGSLEEAQDQPMGVQVDLDDEVAPADSLTVPHTGCLEIKVLKGTDGRAYTLEAMRVTPRDANYVKSAKGTGSISAENLQDVDDNIAMTYVLRHELVNVYAQHKFAIMRQELLQEEVARQRGLSTATKPATAPAPALDDIAPTPSIDADGGIASPAPPTPDWFRSVASPDPTPTKDITPVALSDAFIGEQTEKNEAALAALAEQDAKAENELKAVRMAENEKYAKELNAKLLAISADNLGIVLNANCFIDGFECDADPAVALKDEETARVLADFLYKQTLAGLTEQVRSADFAPLDSEALVDLLHAHGVNMRYLGRLAELANEQENQDRELLLIFRQKIQAMPFFWLEMLEIEVLSRCFKHHLNSTFRSNPEIKQCPAPTIATLLNHVLGGSAPAGAVGAPRADVEVEEVVPKSSVEVKKKKKKSKPASEGSSDILSKSTSIPESPDAGGERAHCLEQLHSLAKSRFCLKNFALMAFTPPDLTTLTSTTTALDSGSAIPAEIGAPDKTAEPPTSTPFLNERISKLTLLRRLCQVTGLRIIARQYDFTSASPFTPDDIVSLTPLMKTCEQSIPMTEVRELMSTARTYLSEGNLSHAFDLAQEASQLLQQITGPIHKEAAMSMDLIANVLIEAGDNLPALSTACKSLSVSVQLRGLDTQDTLQHHSQIAALLVDTGHPAAAVQHLLAAKYLVELMGGPRHPELVTVYFRLVGIYDEMGEYEIAQQCLARAKRLSPNVAKQCMISATIAEMHDKMGNMIHAVSEQRGVHRVMEQLFGKEDEKTLEAKSRVEIFLRKLTVDKLNYARELLALKELEEASSKKGHMKIVGKDVKKQDKNTPVGGVEEEDDEVDCMKNSKKKNKKSKKGKK